MINGLTNWHVRNILDRSLDTCVIRHSRSLPRISAFYSCNLSVVAITEFCLTWIAETSDDLKSLFRIVPDMRLTFFIGGYKLQLLQDRCIFAFRALVG